MDNKKTTATILILSLITLGGYYFWYKHKNSNIKSNNSSHNGNIGTTQTTTNFCDTLGEPLEDYLPKFNEVKAAPISSFHFPQNCSKFQVEDIISTPTFGAGDGFLNNLNGGIIIWNNNFGTQPERAYFLRGNVGGIKCKVLLHSNLLAAAYYDYDTNELKGYNTGIYFTKKFLQNKCSNIPYVIIFGSPTNPSTKTVMDKTNPFMLPYLQQAAAQYNAFISGKDWNGSYDLSGADFMKPTNAIEAQVAADAFLSFKEANKNNGEDITTQTFNCPYGYDGLGRCLDINGNLDTTNIN